MLEILRPFITESTSLTALGPRKIAGASYRRERLPFRSRVRPKDALRGLIWCHSHANENSLRRRRVLLKTCKCYMKASHNLGTCCLIIHHYDARGQTGRQFYDSFLTNAIALAFKPGQLLRPHANQPIVVQISTKA